MYVCLCFCLLSPSSYVSSHVLRTGALHVVVYFVLLFVLLCMCILFMCIGFRVCCCVIVFYVCLCIYVLLCISVSGACVVVCVCENEIEKRPKGRKIERKRERKRVDAKTTRCIPPGIYVCVYLLPTSGNGTNWRWLANVGVVFIVEVFMMMRREEREIEEEIRVF